MSTFEWEKDGKGYRLTADYVHELDFRVHEHVTNSYATIIPSRLLILKGDCEDKRGYFWDGATWCPRWLDRWLLRASVVHDGVIQLIEENLLSHHPIRRYADQELVRIAIEDGLNKHVAEMIMYPLVRAYSVGKNTATGRRTYDRTADNG